MKKTRKSVGIKAARDLVASSPHLPTGGVRLDRLADEDVQHESYIEKSAITALALCHDVTYIASQPVRLTYMADGVERRYTPDFMVRTTFTSGDLYLEVKSISVLVRPKQAEHYGTISSALRTRGIGLAFLVNAQLNTSPLSDWVPFLFRYINSHLREGVASHIEELLHSGPRSAQNLIDCGCELADIWAMVAQRLLCLDWSHPFISLDVLVSLPNQPFEGLSLEHTLGAGRFGRFLGELALGRRTTDQCLMAAAAAWRQPRSPVGPLSNVGGFSDASPIHSGRTAELSVVVPRYGSNQAAGLAIDPPTHSD